MPRDPKDETQKLWTLRALNYFSFHLFGFFFVLNMIMVGLFGIYTVEIVVAGHFTLLNFMFYVFNPVR